MPVVSFFLYFSQGTWLAKLFPQIDARTPTVCGYTFIELCFDDHSKKKYECLTTPMWPPVRNSATGRQYCFRPLWIHSHSLRRVKCLFILTFFITKWCFVFFPLWGCAWLQPHSIGHIQKHLGKSSRTRGGWYLGRGFTCGGDFSKYFC